MSPVIELPFGLPGRIFRSPMPFRPGDEDGQIFHQFLEHKVSVVVLLVTDAECQARTGRNLRQFYQSSGFDVIHQPIPDFDVPDLEALSIKIDAALERARAGQNIAVHCYAGYGRTGMFLACMARQVLGMSAAQAIDWVRSFVPTSIEVPEQIRVVKLFKRAASLP